MTYSEVLAFLESINLSKENCALNRFKITEKAFNLLNLCIDPNKIILVAGTNGKGTTSATLGTLIEAAGKNVGLYTSPHLVSINERIKVNFEDISEAEFIEAFEFINEKCHGIRISHFEYLTLMACYYFFIVKNVDYAIFEVGLGGLYDATNVIPHNMCIISKLGFDHEKYLGNTIESIAENKFGIINNPASQIVVYIPFENKSIGGLLRQKNPKKIVQSIDSSYFIRYENMEPTFYIKTKFGTAKLALIGERAVENTALALTAFNELGFNVNKFLENISGVKWPGRMSKIIVYNKQIYLSGDHNPQGIKSLINLLKFYKYNKIYFIVGIAVDKDYDQILSDLSNVKGAEIYITETAFKPRAISDYGDWLKKCSGFNNNWEHLLSEIVKKTNNDDMIVCTGSLYLIGDILKRYSLNKN